VVDKYSAVLKLEGNIKETNQEKRNEEMAAGANKRGHSKETRKEVSSKSK